MDYEKGSKKRANNNALPHQIKGTKMQVRIVKIKEVQKQIPVQQLEQLTHQNLSGNNKRGC